MIRSTVVSWLSLKMKLGPRCRKYLRDGHVSDVMTRNTSVQLFIYAMEKRRGVF